MKNENIRINKIKEILFKKMKNVQNQLTGRPMYEGLAARWWHFVCEHVHFPFLLFFAQFFHLLLSKSRLNHRLHIAFVDQIGLHTTVKLKKKFALVDCVLDANTKK